MFRGLLNKLYGLVIMIGVGLIVAGYVSGLAAESFTEKAVQTTGTIIGLTDDRPFTDDLNVLVGYTVDGNGYSEKLGYYTEGMMIGQQVEILYNTDNPKQIRSPQAEVPTKELYKLGGILAGGGLALLIVGNALKKRRERLRAERKAEKKLRKEYEDR